MAFVQDKRLFAEGGAFGPGDAWDRLSMTEKAGMMRVAVRNGIYDLSSIRSKYNEFAEGGNLTDEEYIARMERVAEENYQKWEFDNPDAALLHALNDNTYDYRGFYNDNPRTDADADTHWPDTYKTVWHPTFSNESRYSGRKSRFNPLGLTGGHWSDDTDDATFIPMGWQLLQNRHDRGPNLFETGGPKRPVPMARPGTGLLLGKAFWQQQSREPSHLERLAEYNKKQEARKQRELKAFREKLDRKRQSPASSRGLLEERVEENQTEPNDNLWVDYSFTPGKPKNPHLDKKAETARKLAGLWRREHPVLAAWGDLAGAAPLAVAATPFIIGGSSLLADAALATTAGGAIAAGIAPYATAAANTSLSGAPALAWADAGLTAGFGAHGIQTAIDEGGISPMTALELAPMGRVLGTATAAGKEFTNNLLDIKDLKAFNDRYGYTAVKPKYSLAFDSQRLDDVFDYTVKRHNTFVRGVDPYEAQQWGRLTDMTPEDAAEYSLTHIPKVYEGNNAGLLKGENGLYVSNDFGTASAYTNNGSGYVGIVRRPIKYGQSTRREFLKENDFVFSRPPGKQRRFYTTTDEPNNPWIFRNYKGRDRWKREKDSKPVDWSLTQPFEVRANAGARVIEPSIDPDFRHYIFVGDVDQEPVELLYMFKPLTIGSKAHRGTSSVGLSRKKEEGGFLS